MGIKERSVDDRPIFKDVSEDVTFNFIASYNKFSDEMTIILKGHLFVEYMLDMLIQKKISKPQIILKYTFSRKLDILYSLNLIPDYLYKNITCLNLCRNKLAHNLNYKLSKDELTIHVDNNKNVNLKTLKKSSVKSSAGTFCYMILSQLNNHYIQNLKIVPIFP